MTTRRATSSDVARRAGVSRATVSYVLNDAPGQSIPGSTRERVIAAAAELDYTPHAVARALRAGASRLVLLVNTGVPYGTNLSVMIDALAAEVSASGRSLVVWQQSDPADLGSTLEHLQPVVVVVLGRLTEDQRALLSRGRVAYVEAGAGAANPVDHGATLQVLHLAELGHVRLGYLTTTEKRLAMFADPRLAAVEAACAELGLPAPRVSGLPAPDRIAVADLATVLSAWASGPDRVTAVACYNDVCAAACLAAADRAGLGVPRDLAVVGLDDEAMSGFTRPALTTVRLHMADYASHLWARAAAELGLEPDPALEGSGSVHVSLVRRAST